MNFTLMMGNSDDYADGRTLAPTFLSASLTCYALDKKYEY